MTSAARKRILVATDATEVDRWAAAGGHGAARPRSCSAPDRDARLRAASAAVARGSGDPARRPIPLSPERVQLEALTAAVAAGPVAAAAEAARAALGVAAARVHRYTKPGVRSRRSSGRRCRPSTCNCTKPGTRSRRSWGRRCRPSTCNCTKPGTRSRRSRGKGCRPSTCRSTCCSAPRGPALLVALAGDLGLCPYTCRSASHRSGCTGSCTPGRSARPGSRGARCTVCAVVRPSGRRAHG